MSTETLTTETLARDTYQPVGINASQPRFLPPASHVIAEPPTPAKPPRARKVIAWITVAILAIAVVAKLSHHWWTAGRFIETTDDAYIGGDVTSIAPRVAGLIAHVAVSDNQLVRAGDLLLKMDDRDYVAALAKAEAAVAVQEAALINADATLRLQQSLIAQAVAVVAAADAEITRTRDDQSRADQLFKNQVASLQETQRTDAEYKTAFAVGERARAGVDAAKQQLHVIETQKQQIRAALRQAEAERDLARLNLSYTELRAPITGTVANRSGRVGSYAGVGAHLISIIPASGLWIDAHFKESQTARMTPGSPASVEIDAIPGRHFKGHVESIAPATGSQFSLLPPENATGNFTKIVQRLTVRIILDDDPALIGQLRPGLSVTANINTKSSHD
ncbi:MAG TPA: HlyD family secretion protein [Verrucomicrobiae bacterium]|jgi:membrane fusion protein (multidrug efflux system)